VGVDELDGDGAVEGSLQAAVDAAHAADADELADFIAVAEEATDAGVGLTASGFGLLGAAIEAETATDEGAAAAGAGCNHSSPVHDGRPSEGEAGRCGA
jgi:hypothetical protein